MGFGANTDIHQGHIFALGVKRGSRTPYCVTPNRRNLGGAETVGRTCRALEQDAPVLITCRVDLRRGIQELRLNGELSGVTEGLHLEALDARTINALPDSDYGRGPMVLGQQSKYNNRDE